jgi:hypothetical protein
MNNQKITKTKTTIKNTNAPKDKMKAVMDKMEDNNEKINSMMMLKDEGKNQEEQSVKEVQIRENNIGNKDLIGLKDKEEMMDSLTPMLMSVKKENSQLKIQNMDSENEKSDMMNLLIMNSEVGLASKFLVEILRDNLIDYFNVYNESHLVNPVLETYSTHRDMDEDLHMNWNCKCHDCILKRIENNYYNKDMNSKTIAFSKELVFTIEVPDKRYSIKNSHTSESCKMFEIFSPLKETIRLKFRSFKNKYIINNNFNFSNNRMMMITYKDKEVMVSLSSMMIVICMRELKGKILANEFPKICPRNTNRPSKDCMKNFLEETYPFQFENKDIYSVNDMSKEEEIIFFSYCNNKYCYIYLEGGQANNVLNHISWKEFENSSKISSNLLITPVLRKVKFYANSDTDSLQVAEDYDTMEMEEEEDSIPEGWTESDYKATIDEENDHRSEMMVESSMGMVGMYSENDINYLEELDRTLILHRMTELRIFEDVDLEVRTFGKKIIDQTPTFQQKMDQFYKDRFKNRAQDKGYDNNSVEAMSNSSLAHYLVEGKMPNVMLIQLINLTYKEFLCINFFMMNNSELKESVVNNSYKKFCQMIRMLPKMYHDRYQSYVAFTEENFMTKYFQFMDRLVENELVNTTFTKKMYQLFKFRLMCEIRSSADLKEADHKQAEKVNSGFKDWDDSEKSDENLDWSIKVQQLKLAHLNDKKSISNFQPSKSTSEFLKKLWEEDDGIYWSDSLMNKKKMEVMEAFLGKFNNMYNML